MRAKIWLVEDSRTEAEATVRALAAHDVRVFARGDLFVEALAASPPPDLALLDWELPDISGLELCRFIRANRPTTGLPVMLLTSHRDLGDVVRGFEAGASDYMGKPAAPAELLGRAEALLRRAHPPADRGDPGPSAILIVDDSPEALVALEAVVAPVADRIVRASSGEEALACSLREPFAAIVMDVRLPGMSGIEVLGYLRERDRTRTTPVLFVTGEEVGSATMREAYAGGAVDYLPKPVDPDVLRAKVRFFVEVYATRTAYERTVVERNQARLESWSKHSELAQQREVGQRASLVAQGYRESMAVLAHDLRTPLTSLRLAVALLGRELPQEARDRTADRATRAIERMQRLVTDLLDVTRGELGGALPVNPSRAELDVIAEEIAEEHRAANPQRTISLRSQAPGALVGEWDRDRIAQAISNLIANAVQYGRSDRPITIVTRAERTSAVIEVHNDGAPIAEEALSRVFEPMQRGRQDGLPTSLGLGLYIVREIARAHGGEISVVSTAAEGTTFTLSLPRG